MRRGLTVTPYGVMRAGSGRASADMTSLGHIPMYLHGAGYATMELHKTVERFVASTKK